MNCIKIYCDSRILLIAMSIADVVRKSVQLFDMVIEHGNAGGKVIFQKSNGESETLLIVP